MPCYHDIRGDLEPVFKGINLFISFAYNGDWGILQNKCKSATFAHLAFFIMGVADVHILLCILFL
jgi:hypothetical protein